MSGGHFDYKDSHIWDIADQIERIIAKNDVPNEDGWSYDFSPQVIAKLKEATAYLYRASIYAHRVDWLVSGDDGEDTFFERLQDELSNAPRLIDVDMLIAHLERENRQLCETIIDLQRELEHLRGGSH